ncbi:hypothetical protein SAY87_025712 [Trapa incisa]|uniref:Uncharacterized protein n=1 Tax=Trapa incisa TaxID=236973 RepID=A0AAN7GIE7_9MYRT|nr:hypothetical protein SAY87_025712 [Trapa incisa]
MPSGNSFYNVNPVYQNVNPVQNSITGMIANKHGANINIRSKEHQNTNNNNNSKEATSFGGSNIDPTAWKDKKVKGESRFPAQTLELLDLCEQAGSAA